MNQKKHKTANQFKADFTVKQYAAFGLIFNWILPESSSEGQSETRYEKLCKTCHFEKLYQNHPKPDFKPLLKGLRDYFSHYISPFPKKELFKESLASELEFLVREAVAVLEQRGTKLHENPERRSKSKANCMKSMTPLCSFFL